MQTKRCRLSSMKTMDILFLFTSLDLLRQHTTYFVHFQPKAKDILSFWVFLIFFSSLRWNLRIPHRRSFLNRYVNNQIFYELWGQYILKDPLLQFYTQENEFWLQMAGGHAVFLNHNAHVNEFGNLNKISLGEQIYTTSAFLEVVGFKVLIAMLTNLTFC